MASAIPNSAAVLPFFREELLSDNILPTERVANIHRVNLVASAIKPEHARADLIALLEECLERFGDEDEFLFSLAEAMPSLIHFFGGEQYFPVVVPLLHTLTSVEETVVRKQAVLSLVKVTEAITKEENRVTFVQDYIIPVLEQLLKASWFTSRVSACQLLPVTYKYSTDARKPELRKLYTSMCHDETPMVRRAAAQTLTELFAVADSQEIIAHFANSAFQYFWNEQTHESILCSAVEATVALAKKLSTSDANAMYVVPRVTGAATDRSWRVRLTLAEHIQELVEAYASGDPSQNATMTKVIADLLQDPEQEVRTATLAQIATCVKLLPADLLESQIIPTLVRLTLDSSQSVRAALAIAVTKLSTAVGAAVTESHLLSVMEQLMKDEFHEVRLNVVKHAGDIIAAVGADIVHKGLLSALQSLIQDSQWRVRLEVVNQIPQLAKHLGLLLFTSALEPLFLAALTDNVFAVRECAMQNATILTDLFGVSWMQSTFLPRILEHGSGTTNAKQGFPPNDSSAPVLTNGRGKPVSYLSRITILQTLLHLAAAQCVTTSVAEECLMPIIRYALKDAIPNVRFAAVKAGAALGRRGDISLQFYNNEVKPLLKSVEADEDMDVRYFAAVALSLENTSR